MRNQTWSRLASSGKTFGLRDVSKKRRKKKSGLLSTKRIKERNGIISEGEQVQAGFEEIMAFGFTSEKSKNFILSLRGSYKQFGRFTPRQFRCFKDMLFEVRKKKRLGPVVRRKSEFDEAAALDREWFRKINDGK